MHQNTQGMVDIISSCLAYILLPSYFLFKNSIFFFKEYPFLCYILFKRVEVPKTILINLNPSLVKE